MEEGDEEMTLVGITSTPLIGFLTLVEAYDQIKVGNFLKTPSSNVWIIYSESHYTLLFQSPNSNQDGGENDDSSSSILHLSYYDPLARFNEPIKFTLDLNANTPLTPPSIGKENDCGNEVRDDLIPPLNLVLQTKWKGAAVFWIFYFLREIF